MTRHRAGSCSFQLKTRHSRQPVAGVRSGEKAKEGRGHAIFARRTALVPTSVRRGNRWPRRRRAGFSSVPHTRDVAHAFSVPCRHSCRHLSPERTPGTPRHPSSRRCNQSADSQERTVPLFRAVRLTPRASPAGVGNAALIHIAPNATPLLRGESQPTLIRQQQRLAAPVRRHDALAGMAADAEQEMADLMGQDAAENRRRVRRA